MKLTLLFCVIYIVIKFTYSLELDLLKVINRFSSNNYDFYYSCSTCAYSLQWRLNNQSAGTHDVDSTVGELVSSPDVGGTRLRYSAILLSSKIENPHRACMDSILIVARPSLDPIVVQCRGDRDQKSLPPPTATQRAEGNETRGAVELEHVLSQSGIIKSSSADFNTHILMCSSVEIQTWRVNKISAGGFNGPHQIGDRVYQLFNDYPLVLYREAVLTTRSASSDLTSVIVVSTTNTTFNLTITCEGLRDSTELQIFLHSDEMEKYTIESESDHPISLPSSVYYELSSSKMTKSTTALIIIVAMIISLTFTKGQNVIQQ